MLSKMDGVMKTLSLSVSVVGVISVLFLTGALVFLVSVSGQEKPDEKKEAAAKAAAAKARNVASGRVVFERADLAEAVLTAAPAAFRHDSHHRDFPVGAVNGEGRLVVAYVEHDGESDVLWLAEEGVEGKLAPVRAVSEPGIIHQPAIAIAGDGTTWCFWGQTGKDEVVHLKARAVSGEIPGEVIELAHSAGSDSFADAGTDGAGRVWVAWQSMRAGEGDVFCRYLDADSEKWSEEIAVADAPGGDWEPRLAFDGGGGAWVLYDSSRGNEFNLYLARVDLKGGVETIPIAHSPKYEGRGAIARTADGKGFWIAAERGKERWGLDSRYHNDWHGINARKQVLFGRFDSGKKTFEEIPLGAADQPVAPGSAVNLPSVGVDAAGNPWVAYRYYDHVLWSVALTRYDLGAKSWSVPTMLPMSSFGQDRRAAFFGGAEGLRLLWPADLRTSKKVQVAGVYFAGIDTGAELAAASAEREPFPEYPAPDHSNLSDYTPERPAHDRHHWKFAGEDYKLYWGDVHRHTDVSNCRTGFDGCIVEHFRYAYDMGKLDFLGTSDHTDIGKPYDPYEWWHNQRLADVFHTPGEFNSLYVYEREQKWPWGHRNVVFAERGGPIVYINRALYRESQWQKQWPVKAGIDEEISPEELWDVLSRSGKKVAVISHTGATGMGTDWSKYGRIDHAFENVVEIYQGARLSYEGIDVPQPPMVIGRMPLSPETPPPTERDKADFGQYAAGVYQNALAQGHNLGVFASSDHLSEHVSYGGVYVKEFTREGILEGLRARRTLAATDKIYLEFSCGGEPLGSIFETSAKPRLTVRVDGTAPIARVTIVRNEEDYKVFNLREYEFETAWTDEEPLAGENRYYVRVEQWDGNMAWASPVWVKYTGE